MKTIKQYEKYYSEILIIANNITLVKSYIEEHKDFQLFLENEEFVFLLSDLYKQNFNESFNYLLDISKFTIINVFQDLVVDNDISNVETLLENDKIKQYLSSKKGANSLVDCAECGYVKLFKLLLSKSNSNNINTQKGYILKAFVFVYIGLKSINNSKINDIFNLIQEKSSLFNCEKYFLINYAKSKNCNELVDVLSRVNGN